MNKKQPKQPKKKLERKQGVITPKGKPGKRKVSASGLNPEVEKEIQRRLRARKRSQKKAVNAINAIPKKVTVKGLDIERTSEEIAEALKRTGGMVYLAAALMQCAPSTIFRRLKSEPELQQVVLDQRGQFLDVGETALRGAVRKGEPWAVCFALKTLGKARGYIEGVQNTTLNIDMSKLTNEQIERIARGEDPAFVVANPGAGGNGAAPAIESESWPTMPATSVC